MFRQFAGSIPAGANTLFLQHPAVLSTALEVAWQSRVHDPLQPLGHPDHRSNLPQLPDFWLDPLSAVAGIGRPRPPIRWDHLIYAYMIENTRVVEIFRRVLSAFQHGEKLGVHTAAAQHWLRTTEELFYRDAPPFAITSITSDTRPNRGANRRGAYYRAFGMDLNHVKDDGQPYPYIKADVYNNEFVALFEELLRETWVAISNAGNISGPNPTDAGKLRIVVTNLNNMLASRRMNGTLSREEFDAVSMMSWFHLTLEYDSPIVVALRAEGNGPEQRLFKIAQRVSLAANGQSQSYFDIADPISRILIQIESMGDAIVPGLLVAGPLQDAFNTVISHWDRISGRNMKAVKVAVR